MARIHPRICANCVNCEPFDINYGELEDGEVGSCKAKENEIVYLDDDTYCKQFKALKHPRVREEDWWK